MKRVLPIFWYNEVDRRINRILTEVCDANGKSNCCAL